MTFRGVDFNSAAANEFAVRATGGVRFVTGIDGTTGAPTTGMWIVPDGNVGIGTDDPQAPLHVIEQSTGTPGGGSTLILDAAPEANPNILFQTDGQRQANMILS